MSVCGQLPVIVSIDNFAIADRVLEILHYLFPQRLIARVVQLDEDVSVRDSIDCRIGKMREHRDLHQTKIGVLDEVGRRRCEQGPLLVLSVTNAWQIDEKLH